MTSSIILFDFVNREIIILAFQLQEFLINDHLYVNLLNKNIRQLIDHIVERRKRAPPDLFKPDGWAADAAYAEEFREVKVARKEIRLIKKTIRKIEVKEMR